RNRCATSPGKRRSVCAPVIAVSAPPARNCPSSWRRSPARWPRSFGRSAGRSSPRSTGGLFFRLPGAGSGARRWGTPVASYVAGLTPDARPLDRGKPRDEDTEGGNQPADKSLINRRLSLRSQLCAAKAFLPDGVHAERASTATRLLTANIRD